MRIPLRRVRIWTTVVESRSVYGGTAHADKEMRIVARLGQGRMHVAGLMALVSLVVATGGCNHRNLGIEPCRGKVKGLLTAEAEAQAELVQRDPVAYMEYVADECQALEQYTLTFTRHERRGLFQKLYGPEHIHCWFRREPFSVRMKWLDEDVKYGESVYVEGQRDSKVRFVTRWWSPPLRPPPSVNEVDVQTPVFWGEAKRPMTDFGVERLMQRTLKSVRDAGSLVSVTYEGLVQLPDGGPTVHAIHVEYEEGLRATPFQELYIDVATDLPAGTVLKLPSGKIDAAYFYADIDANVELTDGDFVLEAERDGT